LDFVLIMARPTNGDFPEYFARFSIFLFLILNFCPAD